MAIRMRRGLLGELDESKLLAGEWAVTIDAETNRQQVLMCFGAGIVKRMGTYNDFSDMIAEISGDLLNSYKVELEMIKSAVETMASEVNSDKEEVVIIHDGIVNTLMPQIEQYAISTQTSAENASISEQNASRYATNSLDSAELSAEFSDLAKSYAKGGTGLREGEETDNAKYYMEQAKASAGGDYVARTEIGITVAGLVDGKVPESQLPEIGGKVEVDGTTITQNPDTKVISVAKDITDKVGEVDKLKEDLDGHIDASIVSKEGVHDIRYNTEGEVLQVKVDDEWVDCGGGGSSVLDGETALPINDVEIWLKCSPYSKTYNYTTLDDVLSDSQCMINLMSDINSCRYLVRCIDWVSAITTNQDAMTAIDANDYCAEKLLASNEWFQEIMASPYMTTVLHELIPTMTSTTTPKGVVSHSSRVTDQEAISGLNGIVFLDAGHFALNTPEFIKYNFDKKVKIYYFKHFISLRYFGNARIYYNDEIIQQKESTKNEYTILDFENKYVGGIDVISVKLESEFNSTIGYSSISFKESHDGTGIYGTYGRIARG